MANKLANDTLTVHDESSTISPRSVVFLAPDQLYRKRAFDRMNQRESRARKKYRVKELEQENLDLKARVEELERRLARPDRETATTPVIYESIPDSPKIWQVFPLSVPPMCRLDQVIHHLVKSGREPTFLQAAIEEIAHSSFPRVVSLLNPDHDKAAPVAATIGQHAPWMQITSSAARTAVMYNMCFYIRVRLISDRGTTCRVIDAKYNSGFCLEARRVISPCRLTSDQLCCN